MPSFDRVNVLVKTSASEISAAPVPENVIAPVEIVPVKPLSCAAVIVRPVLKPDRFS